MGSCRQRLRRRETVTVATSIGYDECVSLFLEMWSLASVRYRWGIVGVSVGIGFAFSLLFGLSESLSLTGHVAVGVFFALGIFFWAAPRFLKDSAALRSSREGRRSGSDGRLRD